MILPKDPKDLPEGWEVDNSHKYEKGTRYRYKGTDRYLDYHPSHNKKKFGDHWHDSLNEGKKKCPSDQKQKDHLDPGDEVPDPKEPMDPKLKEILESPPKNFMLPIPVPSVRFLPAFI